MFKNDLIILKLIVKTNSKWHQNFIWPNGYHGYWVIGAIHTGPYRRSGSKDYIVFARPRSGPELLAGLRDSGALRKRIQWQLCLHTSSIQIRAACCAAWQCSGTMLEIESSSTMHVVCVPCLAHARPHRIRFGDPYPVNPVSVPVWRALLINKLKLLHLRKPLCHI